MSYRKFFSRKFWNRHFVWISVDPIIRPFQSVGKVWSTKVWSKVFFYNLLITFLQSLQIFHTCTNKEPFSYQNCNNRMTATDIWCLTSHSIRRHIFPSKAECLKQKQNKKSLILILVIKNYILQSVPECISSSVRSRLEMNWSYKSLI